MLSLEKIKYSAMEAVKEAGDLNEYCPKEVEQAIKDTELYAYMGKEFNEILPLFGLHPNEKIAIALKDYYNIFKSRKQAQVCKKAFDIALHAEDKEAAGMVKHITATQCGWTSTSKHELKDTTGQEEFTLERDDS